MCGRTLTNGVGSGITIVALMPSRRAWRATAWAWLPALTATTPAERSAGVRRVEHVAGAALLEGGGELEVLELDDGGAAEHLAECRRDRRRGADDRTFQPAGGVADVAEGDGLGHATSVLAARCQGVPIGCGPSGSPPPTTSSATRPTPSPVLPGPFRDRNCGVQRLRLVQRSPRPCDPRSSAAGCRGTWVPTSAGGWRPREDRTYRDEQRTVADTDRTAPEADGAIAKAPLQEATMPSPRSTPSARHTAAGRRFPPVAKFYRGLALGIAMVLAIALALALVASSAVAAKGEPPQERPFLDRKRSLPAIEPSVRHELRGVER